MSNYVVRQPIKDIDQNVIGYEILFDQGNGGLYNNQDDKAAADAISNFLLQGSDKFFDNKIAFLTFTPNLLSRNIPRMFQQNKLVIQIGDNMIIHPFAQNIVQRCRAQGYRVAVNDFQFTQRYFSMMDTIDFIRLNFESSDVQSFENMIRVAHGFHKKCIAYNVNTKETYDLATEWGVDYVQGSYIAEKLRDPSRQIEYLHGNFFQLVVEITKDEPNLATVEEIISRDVSLTYALLRLVNSAYFALRNKATSIMQALVVLGLGQLKQWIYLLSFRQEDKALPEDLIKESFLRANFCSELLPHIPDMPISRSEAYLMGMFSTLENLMQIPLESALAELAISDEIKEALIHGEGRCGLLYKLVLCYEKADWVAINDLSRQLGIEHTNIAQIYFECIENVNSIWNSLTNPSPALPKEDEAASKEDAPSSKENAFASAQKEERTSEKEQDGQKAPVNQSDLQTPVTSAQDRQSVGEG